MAVCVIGAGINGVQSALEIQNCLPNVQVTIIADKLPPDTLSDIPAGFWEPIFLADPRKQLIKLWGAKTFSYMAQLFKENPSKYGVCMNSGFEFFDKTVEAPDWKDTVYNFKKLSLDDIRRFGYKDFIDGQFFTTYSLEPRIYLQVAIERFKSQGGKLVHKKLQSLLDLGAHNYDVIVNCSGLGAYHLVNDKSCFPIRGQVYRVRAPFMKHFFNFDLDGRHYYCLINENSVVLGGTNQIDNWDTNIYPEDSARIWNALVGLVPALKEAEVIGERVGLRPGRPSIRLEKEIIGLNGKPTSVVHNYGHGGSGITLFYGCALDVAQLVKGSFHKNSKL